MVHAFEYACAHPFLLFLPALIFFLLPVFPAIAWEREAARKEREREARRKAAEEKKRAAAEEKQRKAEQKAAEGDAPKRGPGRPRKHPAPDPNAPKRKPGRPRKAATEQRPEIISDTTPAPGDLEPPISPDEFINRIG